MIYECKTYEDKIIIILGDQIRLRTLLRAICFQVLTIKIHDHRKRNNAIHHSIKYVFQDNCLRENCNILYVVFPDRYC